MKNFKIVSAFLMLFAAAGFVACSDEEPSLLEGGPGFGDTSTFFRVSFLEDQFIASEMAASGSSNSIILTAGDEDTGGVFTMSVATDSITLLDHSYKGDEVVFAYSDGMGGQYTNTNADGTKNGAFKVTAIDTVNQTITGNFSFIGRNAAGETISFFNGSYQKIPFSGTVPPPGGPQILEAKIDSLGVIAYKNMARINNNGMLSIKGGDFETGTSLEILFNNVDIEAGVYELDDEAEEDVEIIYYSASGNSYVSNAGTLTVQSYEGNWLKGIFTFTAPIEDGDDDEENDQSLSITDGEFYIYIED